MNSDIIERWHWTFEVRRWGSRGLGQIGQFIRNDLQAVDVTRIHSISIATFMRNIKEISDGISLSLPPALSYSIHLSTLPPINGTTQTHIHLPPMFLSISARYRIYMTDVYSTQCQEH